MEEYPTLLKVKLPHGCFQVFKSYKWYQIAQSVSYDSGNHDSTSPKANNKDIPTTSM